MSITQVRIGTDRYGRTAWLEPAAAASYERMVEDGCPREDSITEAGRTNARQWELWNRYLRGELVATAAYPGTSKHETGRAIDVNGPTRTWIRKHGHRYGWMRDRVAREPWHMEYEISRDTQLGRAPTPEPITPKRRKEPLMVIIYAGSRYRVISGDRLAGINPDDVPAFQAAGIPVIAVSERTFEEFRAGFTPEG